MPLAQCKKCGAIMGNSLYIAIHLGRLVSEIYPPGLGYNEPCSKGAKVEDIDA